MATVADLISTALKDIGVLEAGEATPASDQADAFAALNRLIDGWQAERLRIYTVTRTEWTIVASTGQYTVGTGGDVNVLRPVMIEHINFQDTSTSPDTEFPLHLLTDDAWAGIRLKDQTSDRPTAAYYNPTYSSGLATLDLWPVPTSSTLEGVLYAPQAVGQFSATSDTVSLPPGYERMIIKALALEVLPSYGRQPDTILLAQARDSKEIVKRANIRPTDLAFDAAALIQGRDRGYYDIYGD